MVRGCFEAYRTADRNLIESLLAEDFTFNSPYDDRIDRSAYFARCWPLAGTFEYHDLKEILVEGDACFVLYDGKARNGKTFHNVEFFRFDGDRIRSVDVFFGRPRELE